jgi:hypothetical protein
MWHCAAVGQIEVPNVVGAHDNFGAENTQYFFSPEKKAIVAITTVKQNFC